jgi:hypothetical protein
VFNIHHGIVQKIAIAETALTTTKKQQRTFINGID